MIPSLHSSPQQPQSYYARSLSAENLKQCYEMAPPRIRQYLEAEVNFIINHLSPSDVALDVGCGYGRVLPQLARHAKFVTGIDISRENVRFGRAYLRNTHNSLILEMNAAGMAFADDFFDAVMCIQNGLSAFHIDPVVIIRECLRVTRPGGKVFLSTYSPKFWHDRLRWFELQAATGLIGEIDHEKTRPGIIVCKDGFSASEFTKQDFINWAGHFNVKCHIEEADESSLFCILRK